MKKQPPSAPVPEALKPLPPSLLKELQALSAPAQEAILLSSMFNSARAIHEAAHAVIALALGGWVIAIVIGGDKPFRCAGKRYPAGSGVALTAAPVDWPERRRALFDCLMTLAGTAGERLLHGPPVPAGGDAGDRAEFEDRVRRMGWGHRRERLERWASALVARHANDIRAVAWLLLRSGDRRVYRRISGANVQTFLLHMTVERLDYPKTKERKRVERVVAQYTHALSARPVGKQARA